MEKFRFVAPLEPSGVLRLADLDRVTAHLRSGGLAVLPTETGYMLAAVATSLPALHAAFAAKQRDLAHPMHVACASLSMADRFAELTGAARRVLGAFTPGPVTAVVRQRDTLPGELVTLNGTVGIRIPDSPATLQVVAELGVPVTATSLNPSGEESRPPDPESLARLAWPEGEVPVVVHPGAVRYASASTLVRLTGPTAEVLRAGPVGAEEIERVLAQEAGAPAS